MKKIQPLILLFAVAVMPIQCNTKTKEKAVTASQQPTTFPTKYDSILTKEQLKAIGIDWNYLKKHLKLQELAWCGGDFRDDQSQPRYEPTKEDFMLTLPFVEYYLQTHGYKKPSADLFQKRIKAVFSKQIDTNNAKPYQSLSGDGSYDFASTYYALCAKGIVTFNWLLNDLVSIQGDKIVLSSCFFKQIMALNNFVIYDDATAFKVLKTMTTNKEFEEGYGGIGDIYGGEDILHELFYTYKYYGNQLLNQWAFTTNKESPTTFFHNIFTKSENDKLIVSTPLIETIERNTTGNDHDYYDQHFALYVAQLLQDEKNMNANHFNIEQKAHIFCYFANSEYKMRKRYEEYMIPDDPDATWDQTAWTAVLMKDCKSIYETARAHNFYGICKPAIMKEIAEKWGTREY